MTAGPDGRYPRFDATEHISGVLRRDLARRTVRGNLYEAYIRLHWAEWVGLEVARHTEVARVTGTTVHVNVDSTSWYTALKTEERFTILKNITAAIGPGIITEVTIVKPYQGTFKRGPLSVKGRGPRDTWV